MSEATAVDTPIVVFISSHQKEFQALRNGLKQNIDGEVLFNKKLLKAELVERRSGTRIGGDMTAALQGSTIYVGIFGTQYSEKTCQEYKEARRRGLPILVFDVLPPKKGKSKRNGEVKSFLEKQVKGLDDIRITTIVARPSRPGEILDTILQRIANVIAEMAHQNLTIRKTVNPQ